MNKWKPEVDRGEADAVLAELEEVFAGIPEIRSFFVGKDAGFDNVNFDVVLVSDFDSREDWATYLRNPAHRAIVDTRLRPMLAATAVLQVEV